MKTLKSFNDAVHGFITIDDELIFQLIEHPYFQRLRRITQLGLTNLVYSGAHHGRFQHALGAMHLMTSAIQVLRGKGFEVSDHELQAAKVAILLHDIGHGPFSHALENTIITGVNHEQVGLHIMRELNERFDGQLSTAIAIYQGTYPVQFLHQLVSSQLDTDRLDYLKRDSFFTGVSEGVIGSERIIKMMTVHEEQLAIEAKGIYSLEKFLMARRLMYWQVYLHKAVLSAEFLLMNILIRARMICLSGQPLFGSEPLLFFLRQGHQLDAANPQAWLGMFTRLDDFDILSAIKEWTHCDDPVLRTLSIRLIDRRLLKTRLLKVAKTPDEMHAMQQELALQLGWTTEDASFLVFQKSLTSRAYDPQQEKINVLFKDGTACDISEAASIFRFTSLDLLETKHYLYFPAEFAVQL